MSGHHGCPPNLVSEVSRSGAGAQRTFLVSAACCRDFSTKLLLSTVLRPYCYLTEIIVTDDKISRHQTRQLRVSSLTLNRLLSTRSRHQGTGEGARICAVIDATLTLKSAKYTSAENSSREPVSPLSVTSIDVCETSRALSTLRLSTAFKKA